MTSFFLTSPARWSTRWGSKAAPAQVLIRGDCRKFFSWEGHSYFHEALAHKNWMTGPLVICWLLLPGLQHQHVFMDRFWISSQRFWTSTKCPWIDALVSVESENIYNLMEGPPSFISIFQSTSREYIEYLDLKPCTRLWKMVFQCGPSWREGSHRCISSSLSILDD